MDRRPGRRCLWSARDLRFDSSIRRRAEGTVVAADDSTMTAARQLSPLPPKPRLVPPRPTPKQSVPPSNPETTEEPVAEVSDTCIQDVVALASASPELARALSSRPPPPLPQRAVRKQPHAVVLARTVVLFVGQLAVEAARGLRALPRAVADGIKVQWARASARASAAR